MNTSHRTRDPGCCEDGPDGWNAARRPSRLLLFSVPEPSFSSMRPRHGDRGVTVIEMLVAVAIGALIIMIAVPAFRAMMDRQRLDTATRQMVNDLWNARSKAVATGWEYKIIGFGNTSTDTKKNQYRLLGRSSSAVAWPADTVAAFTSTTQSAGAWTDLSQLQTGIQFTPGGGGTNARFEIAFNPAGGLSVNSGDFNPFTVTMSGTVKTIRVSVVGGVTAQ